MHGRRPKRSHGEAAREHLTILHLSDPQFGKNHRFGSKEPFDTLFERLKEDLLKLRSEKELAPDLAVLTGDLAEWGLRSEFQQALDFLVRLCELLELKRDRVAVIPGNHDINRDLCESYFKGCKGRERAPLKPYWPKWEHYVWFFESFYRDCPGARFTEEEPWSLFDMPELRVVVAGLNSTMRESHLKGTHKGWVEESQLRWFQERLKEFRERGWLRIGAVHHNVVRGAVNDDENLRDAQDMRRILDQHVNMVLHGHTHHGALDWWGPELPLISTGSAALAKNALQSEFPNQYQFLRLWPDRFCRRSRQYALEQKRWIADPRVSMSGEDGKEDIGLAFRRVSEAFRASREQTLAPLEQQTSGPEAYPYSVPGGETQRGDAEDLRGRETRAQEAEICAQLPTSRPPETGGVGNSQVEPALSDAGCAVSRLPSLDRTPAEPDTEGFVTDGLAAHWLAATDCQAVAWQPDGDLFACGYQTGVIAIWESATGQVVRTLAGHGSAVRSVAWSPDGQRLASASSDGTLRIWATATGACLAILLPLPEGWVAFTPEGRYKLGGHIGGGFWHTIGLCRFEPGELDPYLPKPLRIPDDEPLIPGLAGR